MLQDNTDLLLELLRSAITGKPLENKGSLSQEQLRWLYQVSRQHDLAHLVALALQSNGLLSKGEEAWKPFGTALQKAVFRDERMEHTVQWMCNILEAHKIPFVPLKGAVLRKMYPESWMRTSADLDILIHPEDMTAAVDFLTAEGFAIISRGSHDVGLRAENKTHVELHFELMEMGKAQNANVVSGDVWQQVQLCPGWQYRYEMTPGFFYFYHIAHMAKHFAAGGCGFRTFLDIWVLTQAGEQWTDATALLEQAQLQTFAQAVDRLSKVWFDGQQPTETDRKMEEFILCGGIFGTVGNRVALQQHGHGGKKGYITSRLFASREKLTGYYPILKKRPWLMPVMQVRRWLWLLRPRVSRMAKGELAANRRLEKDRAEDMHGFLKDIGLQNTGETDV